MATTDKPVRRPAQKRDLIQAGMPPKLAHTIANRPTPKPKGKK